jgi:hypothetical protein
VALSLFAEDLKISTAIENKLMATEN